MEWLKQIFKRIFCKNKIKLLEEPKVITELQNKKNDFFIELRRQAEVEADDGNGYKIIKNINLWDMV